MKQVKALRKQFSIQSLLKLTIKLGKLLKVAIKSSKKSPQVLVHLETTLKMVLAKSDQDFKRSRPEMISNLV